jgi:putative DNA primase/helicase
MNEPKLSDADIVRLMEVAEKRFPAKKKGGTTPAHNQPSERRLIVKRAADISPEPVEWLWPGRIAIGKQTLVAGEAGLGKSQVTIAVAGAVSKAGPWPCGEGSAPLGNVIILSAEDGASDTVIPRLMAAGADLDRIHLITAVATEDGKGRRAFDLQSDLDLLEAKIRQIRDVKLVIIDPISSYLGRKVDSHVNAAVRATLEPVGEMAERLGVAIVSITHPPKGSTTTAINRFIGSVAFVAAARSAFMVTRDADNEERRLFLPVKNNLAPLGKGLAFWLEQRIVGDPGKGIVNSAVHWESEPVTITADQALAETDGGAEQHGARREAEEFLREILAHPEGVAAKDAEEEARAKGIASRTLKRARKKLGVVAEKSGMEGGWIWRLPAEGGQQTPKSATFKSGPLREKVAPFEEPDGSDGDFEQVGDGLDIPDFLRRDVPPDRRPALGPAGDSLDDLK